MRPVILFAILVVTFALFFTIHGALSFRIARKGPVWQGAAAFFVPPLAPYFAFRLKMLPGAIAWLVALVLYATLLVLANR